MSNQKNDKAEVSLYKDRLRDFFLSIVLLGVSVFVIFQQTTVTMHLFSYSIGGFGLPTGVILIPLLISFAVLFYDSKSFFGKMLLFISVILVIVTLILSVRIRFNTTSMLTFAIMFGSFFAGLGLFIKSMFKK